MSAITVARLDDLRAQAMASARSENYQDALRKAPGLIVVGHLLRAAGHLVVLAARVGTGRARR